MNTLSDFRSILRLLGGCLFCMGLAMLGFYPFADQKRRHNHILAACARKGIKAWIT